jgi:serine/threonine protein kinase
MQTFWAFTNSYFQVLLTKRGHIKLTDFGLSKVGLRDRELHIQDLITQTPAANSRYHCGYGGKKELNYSKHFVCPETTIS